ncbi:MAG TPA: alpha/beta fold hydrolase [Mycobacteriales bacterium]|nr:alpha/beta fold hydrolase [Mycobacteriales bacterium]
MNQHPPAVRFREPDGGAAAATSVALVLHGGKVRSRRRSRRWQLAVARMQPFSRHLSRAGHSEGLAVGTVLFGVRGWNDEHASPVADVQEVLATVRHRYGDLPVVLIGHSMGGRAALRSAGDPSVVGVVALAPWLEEHEPVAQLRGKRLLILHGDRDRWTDPKASLRFAQQVQGIATSAGRVSVAGDGHSMLRRASLWHSLTTSFTLRTLGRDNKQSASAGHTKVLDSAGTGQVRLVV